MKSINDIKVSENLNTLANLLREKAELYIVGGYVRNQLLGFGGTDIDLCGKLTPTAIKKLLIGTPFSCVEKNKILGTAIIKCGSEVYEYSTFRQEVYADDGSHTPISVKFVEDIHIDAKRRDFAINCIYYSITKHKLIDIYSGIYDIKQKQIKTIETPQFVFGSDGLRILRLIRISCELGFKIEKQTLKIAKQMSYRLKDISGNRKKQELLQIVDCNKKYKMSSPTAHITAIKFFNQLNIFTNYYCTTAKIKLNIFKKAKNNKFVALLIDILSTIKPENVEYYLKYMLGEKGLMFTKVEQEGIINVVSGYFDALAKVCNKDFFFKYYTNFEIISEFLNIKHKGIFTKYNFFYKYINNYHIPVTKKQLAINGDDIKKCRDDIPENRYSQILNDLLSKVFDGQVLNTKNQLTEEIKKWKLQ